MARVSLRSRDVYLCSDPGGWHAGWYFQAFAEALRARGHRAYPITLTGLGERRHLLNAAVNLETHIEDVVQILATERLTDVVLLGHSYGGMVLTGVIDRAPDRIAAAIYSDAYVPAQGESCFDLANDLFRGMFLEGAAQDGFSVPPPPGLDPRATAHPLAAFLQRLRLANTPLPFDAATCTSADGLTRRSRQSTNAYARTRFGKRSRSRSGTA